MRDAEQNNLGTVVLDLGSGQWYTLVGDEQHDAGHMLYGSHSSFASVGMSHTQTESVCRTLVATAFRFRAPHSLNEYLSNCIAGKGVTIYPIDSGIRTSHQEFQPWGGGSSRARAGPDFVDDDNSADDCDGHGGW